MPETPAFGGGGAATWPHLLLDISRTVARARLPVPTGIDRVERAYIAEVGQGAVFLCRVGAEQVVLGPEVVRALLGWLEQGDAAPPMDLAARLRPWRDGRLRRAQALGRRGACGRARTRDRAALTAMLKGAMPEGGVLLNVGHDNLDAAVLGAARAAGLRSAVLIHDVIPLDHPQFARPGSSQRFRAKLDAACGADLIVCNSCHTRERLAATAPAPLPPVVVAPLGVDPPAPDTPPAASPEAYFVCLGTVEPRKNHALLLGLWQRMWEVRGEAGPRLHIVGRRGWRNAGVFRSLDSAPMMGRTVHEHGQLEDRRVSALLAGARALLFPSFAEGFGLPLAEALALGTPVLASDLPALREIGGDVPDWLGPGDMEGWQRAVADYTAVPSPRREAQLSRLERWRPPRWQEHFRIVANALATDLAERRQRG